MTNAEPHDDDDAMIWLYCAVCSQVPPELRGTLRESLTSIPLRKYTCEECLVAWWLNISGPSEGSTQRGRH